jgi:hypothetical protein
MKTQWGFFRRKDFMKILIKTFSSENLQKILKKISFENLF